jgi:uncharacterized protein (UPF0264 family)
MQLLVSVRDAEEAKEALEGGAAIIDVKEPRRGALGAADPTRWREIIETVAGRVPVSLALGELQHLSSDLIDKVSAEVSYAKIGLAGCRQWPDWFGQWQRTVQQLRAAPVAVIYADWQASQSPPPGEILLAARQLRCPFLLCDTHNKQAGGLFDHLDPETLGMLRRTTRQHGIGLVLAGSLGAEQLPSVIRYQPDFVAIRGAACAGGRLGKIQRQKVRQLTERMAPTSHPQSPPCG